MRSKLPQLTKTSSPKASKSSSEGILKESNQNESGYSSNSSNVFRCPSRGRTPPLIAAANLENGQQRKQFNNTSSSAQAVIRANSKEIPTKSNAKNCFENNNVAIIEAEQKKSTFLSENDLKSWEERLRKRENELNKREADLFQVNHQFSFITLFYYFCSAKKNLRCEK